MKSRTLAVLVLSAMVPVVLAQKGKPTITVAVDGFPTGQSTPEGAACDFSRAFIKADSKLLLKVVMPPSSFGGKEYAAFLTSLTKGMKQEAARKTPSPGHPQKITKCATLGKLSKNGPNSYAYAALDLQEIGFVDIECTVPNGKAMPLRVFLVKSSKTWFVDPAPQLSPLLSYGLNSERPTGVSFSAKYNIVRH